MAKLKSMTFSRTDKTGERYSFTSDVSVKADGEFSLTIPPELHGIARRLLEADNKSHTGMKVGKPLVNHVVSGRDLAACERLVEAAIRDHMAVATHTELVIRYGSVTSYRAFLCNDGTHRANAVGVHGHADAGEWVGNLTSQAMDTAFRIGLFAKVYRRSTHTRGSGSTVTYDRPDGHGEGTPTMGDWGRKLNGLVGLSWDPRETSAFERSPSPRLEDMAYREDAAEFWYEAMMGLVRLAHRIDAFVGDGAAIARAVGRGSSFLALASPGGPAEDEWPFHRIGFTPWS